MAKLTDKPSRQALAFVEDEDDAFLRPSSPGTAAQRRGSSGPRAVSRKAAASARTAESSGPYLRTRRRIPPRKSGVLRNLLRSRIGRWTFGLGLLLVLGAIAFGGYAFRNFLLTEPHFRLAGPSSIETAGNQELTRDELTGVFQPDFGRSVFAVPLAKRRAGLEELPWVQHATVMRLLPNRIRVAVVERTPIAFVRINRQIELVDGNGVILSMSPMLAAAHHYSFPVVTGLDPAGTPDSRAERMHLYQNFVHGIDADGAHISSQLSEVDLSDVDDVRAVVPAAGSDVLLHFGDSNFAERYHKYQQHIGEWRQQYPGLSAVDLRYDRQVVLKMDPAPAAAAGATNGQAANAPAQVAKAPVAAHGKHPVHAAPRHRPAHWAPHYVAHAGRG